MDSCFDQFLEDYLAGRRETAAQQVIQRFHERLRLLARSRLSKELQRRVDSEDILQSVYRSFFRKADDDQLAHYRNCTLWRLLGGMTIIKVFKRVERERAQKRDPRLEDYTASLIETMSKDPTPEDSIDLLDEFEKFMEELRADHRPIVEARLEGQSLREIGELLNLSEATVRRVLRDVEHRLRQLLYSE